MKVANILLASAAAATAAVLPRQDQPTSGNFELSDFSFSGERFSIYEFYRFGVKDAISNTTCSTTTSEGTNIAPFGYTPCADPAWSFGFFYVNWTNPGPGYTLQITREVSPGYNETGCRYFSQSDVKTTQDSDPNAVYQYLDAPQSFELPWTNHECIFA